MVAVLAALAPAGAIAQASSVKPLEARVEAHPEDPDAHFALAEDYRVGRYRVPAVLAYARLLSLEPNTARSAQARKRLDEIFGAGVKTDPHGSINLMMSSDSPRDEGDFGPVELVMSMSEALGQKGEKRTGQFANLPPAQQRLGSTLAVFAELPLSANTSAFATRFYGAFYRELHVKKGLEAFVKAAYGDQKAATP